MTDPKTDVSTSTNQGDVVQPLDRARNRVSVWARKILRDGAPVADEVAARMIIDDPNSRDHVAAQWMDIPRDQRRGYDDEGNRRDVIKEIARKHLQQKPEAFTKKLLSAQYCNDDIQIS